MDRTWRPWNGFQALTGAGPSLLFFAPVPLLTQVTLLPMRPLSDSCATSRPAGFAPPIMNAGLPEAEGHASGRIHRSGRTGVALWCSQRVNVGGLNAGVRTGPKRAGTHGAPRRTCDAGREPGPPTLAIRA